MKNLSIIFVLIFIIHSFSRANEKFIYYKDTDGLPRNIVHSIAQDSFGYTWIGTGNGISKFNGYQFVNDPLLSGHSVNVVFIDENNKIWLGTDRGLFAFLRKEDTFQKLFEGYVNQIRSYKNSIYVSTSTQIFQIGQSNEIKSVYESNNAIRNFEFCDDHIYVSEKNNGVFKGKIIHSQMVPAETIFPDIDVSALISINSTLWIGSRSGKLFKYQHNSNLEEVPLNNHHPIKDIVENNQTFLIATDGNGLISISPEFVVLNHRTKNPYQTKGLSSNSIYDIFVSKNKQLWLSTYGGGITCIFPFESPFVNLEPDINNVNSLVADEGTMAFVDKNNNFWLGTNYGLSVWQQNINKFTNLSFDESSKILGGTKFLAATQTYDDHIWIGLFDGPLVNFSPKSFLKNGILKPDRKFHRFKSIIDLEVLDKNHIIVASQAVNQSLSKFNINTLERNKYLLSIDDRSTPDFQVVSVKKDKENNCIVGIKNRGIFKIKNEQMMLENHLPEINNRITFKINDFYCESSNSYWFASANNGLINISGDGKTYEKWNIENGFPTNTLLRIESIDNNILWISSINGLIQFDIKTKNFNHFDYRKGLNANEFKPWASAKSNNNELVFGSVNGFSIFNPNNIQHDPKENEVTLSDITFYNQSIKQLNQNFLDVPIELCKKVSIPHRFNSFTIHFFSNNLDLPKYNRYAFKLENFESNWTDLGENTQTTYTNLSSGTYNFMVRCTNNDNSWSNKIKTLEIKINPPWYSSIFAILAYFILFNLGIILFVRTYYKRVKLRRQIEMSNYKLDKEKELTEKKISFFTNISHDLKTPLTLINAPLEDLLNSDGLDREQIKKLQLIKKNSNRLYKLINDVIQFRKLIHNQLDLQVKLASINHLLNNIYDSFEIVCSNKNIQLIIDNQTDDRFYMDENKLETILWNLTSNAIKFTNYGGTVSIRVNKTSDELKIEVSDTGEGLDPKDKDRIFDRFYQVHNQNGADLSGSGIGLSIVKELVELHHGKVEVNSTKGKGTSFFISIPVNRENYSDKEVVEGTELSITRTLIVDPEIDFDEDTMPLKRYKTRKILIVEDNQELRSYLKHHFSNNFTTYTAENGLSALNHVRLKEPDLIITDVMMPKMDGFELCRTLKANFNTSHIPLIMLTAGDTTESKVKGMQLGADVYITKPFKIQYLEAVIQSIFTNRDRLKEKLSGLNIDPHSQNDLSEKDNEFILRLKQHIDQNLANPLLDIDHLAKEMACSKAQFNRKLKALMGTTPNNLLKKTRLNRAYELLKNNKLSVTEASYQTGFSDPNYFTTCFKKEFGQSPSQIK